MDAPTLANEIIERANALRRCDEKPLTHGELCDDGELLMALARIVRGIPVERAFGSPGDWGYSHPIGKALYAKGEK